LSPQVGTAATVFAGADEARAAGPCGPPGVAPEGAGNAAEADAVASADGGAAADGGVEGSLAGAAGGAGEPFATAKGALGDASVLEHADTSAANASRRTKPTERVMVRGTIATSGSREP
jgi:hypothetical protein